MSGQRPDGDFDELPHREFEIGRTDALRTKRRRTPDGSVHTLDLGRHRRNRRSGKDIIAGTYEKADRHVVLAGPVGKAVLIELLEIAASRIDDRQGLRPGCHGRRISFLLLCREALHGVAHLLMNEGDHGIDVDAPGHMTDEVDQRADADESEQYADAQRQMWNELTFGLGPHLSQNHQRIAESAEKGAEHRLVAAILGEIAQQTRAHLAGCQRQGCDGDREDRHRDSDGRRYDGPEQGAGARSAANVEPAAMQRGFR